MDLINKGFSSFLIIALIFLAVAFLINILPVILVAAAGIWAISYAVKKIKLFINNRKYDVDNKVEADEVLNNVDLSQRNVIDVDYTEIK